MGNAWWKTEHHFPRIQCITGQRSEKSSENKNRVISQKIETTTRTIGHIHFAFYTTITELRLAFRDETCWVNVSYRLWRMKVWWTPGLYTLLATVGATENIMFISYCCCEDHDELFVRSGSHHPSSIRGSCALRSRIRHMETIQVGATTDVMRILAKKNSSKCSHWSL